MDKLRRGFRPTRTGSWHWVGEPAFAAAIGNYLNRERAAIEAYIDDAREQLPFHRAGAGGP